MTVELFMTLLTICAVVSSLITEALKKTSIFKSNNILALIVSVLTGAFAVVFTYIRLGISFNTLNIMYLIAFVVANFVSCTVGYDKVVQTIKQIMGE